MAPSFPQSDVAMEEAVAGTTAPLLCKRKTPLQLREEQAKRSRTAADEQSKANNNNVSGSKSAGLTKQHKYVDTRVVDIYPITKIHDRFKSLTSKDACKANAIYRRIPALDAARLSTLTRSTSYESGVLDADSKNKINRQMAETRVRAEFCNVAVLSSSVSKLPTAIITDMTKAFKGLAKNATSKIPSSNLPGEKLKSSVPSSRWGLEAHKTTEKTLLDLTLKTSMRIVSSSSFSWCQKIANASKYAGMREFMSFCPAVTQDSQDPVSKTSTDPGVSLWHALHSWVHPQSTLSPSIISAMSLSAARGSTAEGEFLSQRQLDWQESFRSLYYMLRKGECNIFYVCMHQFLVMFINSDAVGKTSNNCAAYITRSTRGLRALLKEHDVGFVMPLVAVEEDPANTEDLRALSEFEKMNPGQTKVVDYMCNVDNTPQSLLAFLGNSNVHAIYDFLLNHRSLLSSVACVDVPRLYSAVPFENASLHLSKISCKEITKAEALAKASVVSRGKINGFGDNSSIASTDKSYSVEVKGGFLPPWVVSRLCATFSKTHQSFEVSFVTEPFSLGLNSMMSSLGDKISGVTLFPSSGVSVVEAQPVLKSGYVKNLSYKEDFFESYLSHI